MSKLQAKNLHYDSTLPPFLARLQANKSDRNEFQAARPKKPRNAEDDADDEPVYFDEDTGDTLTKSEWEKRDAEEIKFEGAGGKGEEGTGKEGVKEVKEKVAVIGTSKKRKAGKVVGGEEEDKDSPVGVEKKSEGKKTDKKAPKKGKKVKLSFGDDE